MLEEPHRKEAPLISPGDLRRRGNFGAYLTRLGARGEGGREAEDGRFSVGVARRHGSKGEGRGAGVSAETHGGETRELIINVADDDIFDTFNQESCE